MKWTKEIRAKKRQTDAAEKTSKTVHEYSWKKLLEDGQLGKLTVMELNKYLEYHNLPLWGNKADKIKSIAVHLTTDVTAVDVEEAEDLDDEGSEEVIDTIGDSDSSEDEGDSDEDESDSEEDFLSEIDKEKDNEDSCSEEIQQNSHLTTRSGRIIKKRDDCFLYY